LVKRENALTLQNFLNDLQFGMDGVEVLKCLQWIYYFL
jgi:hypothetical protein